MRYAPLMIAAAMLVSTAPAIARPPRVPVAETKGPPVTCIPIGQIRETRVRDDSTIDFRLAGNRWYRSVLPNSCPLLGFEQRFSYATSIYQLCNVDIITVLQQFGPGFQPGARCGLGKFQPVTLAKR